MLADMVSIICGIEDVSVVQLSTGFHLVEEFKHHFIDSLKCSQSTPLMIVIVSNLRVVQWRQLRDPANCAIDCCVETVIARDHIVFEQIPMPICDFGCNQV